MLTSTGIGSKYLHVTAMLLVAMLAPHAAHATLGQPEATVASDVAELKGSVKSTERTNYRVHEIQLPGGTVLREFATLGGSIFALAWSGPSMPNLQQTLGSYMDSYVAAAKAPHPTRRMVHVRTANLVIESAGHMRAFTGRAYLPQAIPAGVSVDELH